jgi:hypothetical protein
MVGDKTVEIGRGGVAVLPAAMGHAALQPSAADSAVVVETLSDALTEFGAASSSGRAVLDRKSKERLTRALSARGLDNREIQPPSPEVLVPATEAMSYAPGKQEMANLIASAMDPQFNSAVLPSHVDVLKQLTLDELALLRLTPPYGFSCVMADLVFILASGQVTVAYRNIAPQHYAGACATPSNIPQYMDNLIRLRLVYSDGEDERAEDVWRTTAHIPFVRKLIARRPAGSKAGIRTWSMRLTDFGEQLRRACLY